MTPQNDETLFSERTWGIAQNVVAGILVAAILGMAGLVSGYGSRLVDLERRYERKTQRVIALERAIEHIREDHEEFRKPGGRFTDKNGEELEDRMKIMIQLVEARLSNEIAKLNMIVPDKIPPQQVVDKLFDLEARIIRLEEHDRRGS